MDHPESLKAILLSRVTLIMVAVHIRKRLYTLLGEMHSRC